MSPKLKDISDAVVKSYNTPVSEPLYDLIWYVAELEARLAQAEQDAKAGAIARYRQSCLENGITPD